MSLFTGSQSDSGTSPRLKILVVDDDVLNRSLMQVLLTHAGYRVAVASNGLEACNVIKYQRFDIVFMDLYMPVMDGMESSRCIREWENGGQHTFIIALTASYLPDEGRELFEAGIDDYISKPFELEYIQRILKYRADTSFIPPA
jgi:CheY-like chemotaxis protein